MRVRCLGIGGGRSTAGRCPWQVPGRTETKGGTQRAVTPAVGHRAKRRAAERALEVLRPARRPLLLGQRRRRPWRAKAPHRAGRGTQCGRHTPSAGRLPMQARSLAFCTRVELALSQLEEARAALGPLLPGQKANGTAAQARLRAGWRTRQRRLARGCRAVRTLGGESRCSEAVTSRAPRGHCPGLRLTSRLMRSHFQAGHGARLPAHGPWKRQGRRRPRAWPAGSPPGRCTAPRLAGCQPPGPRFTVGAPPLPRL
jgi:hypothetical protein